MRKPSNTRAKQLVAISSVAWLAGCSHGPRPQAITARAAGPEAKTVGVVPVSVGDISRTITQPATMQGIEEATLYARAAGYVREISVDKGDRVRAGQVLAVIESPELAHQEEQARATYQQARAATLSVEATRGRAEADVAQAAAAIERARADASQAQAAVGRVRADLARTEAQLPKLQSLIAEAEANVQQAVELHGQSLAEVARYEQQTKTARASVRAAQSVLQKAQADARLQQLTYNRLKAIQDKDKGLVAGQEVDVARARMEASQSEVESASNRLDAAREEAATIDRQVDAAKRSSAAAARKVEALKSRVQATQEDVKICRREIETAQEQVKVAQAQAESAGRQVRVTEAQHRAALAQVKVANAQIIASNETTAGTRSALSAAATMAGYRKILAPFDGVVTERLVDVGAFVQNASGNQASARGIVKLVRDSSLRVLVPVPEMNLPYIRAGKKAVIKVDTYPKEEFSGSVTRSASAVDPKSRTMLTEVDIPNPGRRLRPGMYARVTLTLETHRNALSIPSEAVMGPEDDRFVYVVANGKAQRTSVTVGVDSGKTAEITSGLTPDAQVVLVGRDTLVNGAAVKAEPAKLEPAKK